MFVGLFQLIEKLDVSFKWCKTDFVVVNLSIIQVNKLLFTILKLNYSIFNWG